MSDTEDAAKADPPMTVELLADLQAGVLPDEVAARLRKRVREDPRAQEILRALNQVRHDISAAGTAPAPDPPPTLASKLAMALKSVDFNPVATHSARPHASLVKVIASVAGLGAAVAAIGIGTAALLETAEPTPTAPATAEHITVSRPPAAIPLSEAQILGLLASAPDYGPLSDPVRRASCLSGLGYSTSTPVLGARPIDIDARQGVLLVVGTADMPDKLAVFAVATHCSAADTGLLASTAVPRP